MSKQVEEADLRKALDALQDVAKGHNSRGTVTTEVESMKDAGASAGSDAGSTQVHHTASNSNRGTWAGSTWSGVPEDGAVDSVKEDGTDYDGVGEMMKSIMDKLSKGQELTAKEFSVLKAFTEDKEDDTKKAKSSDDLDAKKSKDKDRDDDDDEEMDKSLSDYASQDEKVSKGLEVSEFLAGWAGVMHKSLESTEKRIVSRVIKALSEESAGTGEFQKSLAEAVVNLGEAVTAVAQRQDQIESQPARGPKSVQAAPVQAIEKGSYGGPQGAGEPLSKSLVRDTLVDMVEKGQCSAQDVIKFESNGDLPEHLETKVRAHVGR